MRSADSANGRGAQVAALTSTLLIAQQVAGKAARDALFLSNFQPSKLPLAMATGALLSLLAMYWVSRLVTKHAPAAVMPLLFAVSSVGFGLEWLLAFSAPRAAALVVYFQTALLGPVMISTFWSVINERFDPHTAKRAVTRIAGGGTLGGLLGGLAVWRASSFVQPVTVLLLLALLNGLAVVGALLTRARAEVTPELLRSASAAPASADFASPFDVLRTTPFLRQLALLVMLGAAISALLDYVFSVQAAAAFGKGQPMLAFFSLFWLGVSVVSFLLQVTVGRLALEKLGLAVNIAVLPAIIVLGGAFGLAVPGLVSSSLLRGAEAVQRNTLFRSAYELLYTPLPDERKRSAKAIIDVGFDRLGTVAGSGITLLVLHTFAPAQGLLLGAVILLGLATLPVARQLHLGYVEALAQGLRAAAARLHDPRDPASPDVPPPDSRRTALERDKLIERVEVLHPGGLSTLVEAGRTDPLPSDEVAPAPALDGPGDPHALLSTAYALLSADDAQVKRGLGQLEPHGPAIACAIRLLASPVHGEQALHALRSLAPSITGQLLDALLDPSQDFLVRRKLPRALRTCSTQRAADGLMLGISDERFEVRYACGRALLSVTAANPAIVISQQGVLDAVQREIQLGRSIVERSGSQLDEEATLDDQQALVDGLVRDRADRSLEHVFTILSLILERDALRMAFLALHHHDDQYRGTALEYLNTVLPAEIRDMVWPFLGATTPLPTARPAQELLADLARAQRSGLL